MFEKSRPVILQTVSEFVCFFFIAFSWLELSSNFFPPSGKHYMGDAVSQPTGGNGREDSLITWLRWGPWLSSVINMPPLE